MVEDVNTEQIARSDELPGDFDVLARRGGVSGGMIVNNDDRGAVPFNGVSEDLGYSNVRSVETADVDRL
jgi:hypothetical protein